MFNKKHRGQEAVEFVLLSVLVFFGTLFAVLTFGDKIASFFTQDSAVAKSAQASSSAILSNAAENYAPDYETKAAPETPPNPVDLSDPSIAIYNPTQNADGSVSFQVGSQVLNLPSKVLELQNTVTQSTGSSGTTDLIKGIASMIEKYKSDYPLTDVPVVLSFGSGTRIATADGDTYSGNASVNATTVKIGDHLFIYQKDQTYTGTDANSLGYYSMVLNKQTDGSYTGAVSGYSQTHSETLGGTVTVSPSNITATDNTVTINNGFYDCSNSGYDANWNFSFNDPANFFAL